MFKKKILPYLIAATVGIAIMLAIVFANGVHIVADTKTVLQILCDGFFVPGVILACVGLFVFASNGGAFDMLAYAVILFFNLFRKDVNKRKYKDFYEYREAKKDRHYPIAFLLIVGLVFLAVAGALLIAYFNV